MKPNVKYIFCINTGRSGSRYLYHLFNHVSNCKAVHERKPVCNGQIMRDYLLGNPDPMRQLTEEKTRVIQEIRGDCDIYVETNHCFIKGFGWFIPDYLSENEIGVIILTRDKQKIAKSTLRIGCSPLLNKGRKWIMTPDIENPLVSPPTRIFSAKLTYHLVRLFNRPFTSERKLYNIFNLRSHQLKTWINDYELECLNWYVDETMALANAYQKRFRTIKYIQVDLEELNDFEGFSKVLNYFGLSHESTIYDVIGKKTNLKLSHGTTKANTTSNKL